MNIIFKNLHIEHFLSFGIVDINLQEPGYTLISGRNDNPIDNAKSNGSGKSAIWDALSYCITGSTLRGTKDIVNMKEEGGCLVEAVFAVNNIEYKIIRTKEHSKLKTTCKLYINGEDKSGKGLRETQALIEEHLPDLTPQLIGSVILFGQGLPNRFSNNTPSGRKEVLEKLSKSDFMIEDLRNKITCRTTSLNEKYKEVSNNILKLSTQREMKEREVQTAETRKSQLGDFEELLNQKNLFLNQLDSISRELNENANVIKNKQDKLNAFTSSYTEINKNMNNELFAYQEQIKEIQKPIENSKQIINAKIYSLNNEIKRLKNIKDTCPTCGQKLPNVTKPDISIQENELINLNNEFNELNGKLNKLSIEYTENVKQIKELYNNQLSNLEKERNILTSDIKSLTNHINELKAKETELRNLYIKIDNQVQIYENTLTTLNNTISEGNEFIKEIDSKILYYNNESEKLKIRLDIENKFMTIIKRDFRGYLLTNVIQYIEAKAKEYAKQIFNNDRIGFSLEGNDIDITYDNKEYSSLSTGERQKVDLIVQFALRDMLCKYLDFDSNILVCDELFDGLDSLGCNKVVDLIANLTNITSIYIVSHRQDLSLPVDRNLTVVKNISGISTIENM